MRGNVGTFYFPQTKMATEAANACVGTSALFIFSKLRWRPRRRTQYFRAFNFQFSPLSENSPFVHVWADFKSIHLARTNCHELYPRNFSRVHIFKNAVSRKLTPQKNFMKKLETFIITYKNVRKVGDIFNNQ